MEDILQYNDRVIHDHADAQCNATERHHIERDAQCRHYQEGKQDAARHRDGNRKRRTHVSQEYDQDNRRKQHTHPDVAHRVVDRHIDVVGLVHDQIPFERAVCGQRIELRLGALGNLDRIRAGLLVDRQEQALLAVDLSQCVAVLRLHGNVSNLAQAHCAARRQRDQRVLNIVDRLVLAVRAHGQRLRTAIQLAARHGHIVRAQLLCNRRNGQIIALEAGGVGLDRDLVLIAAHDIDRSHAVQTFQRGRDLLIGQRLQAGQIGAAQRDHDDRHRVDVDRHDGRVGRILGQHGFGLIDLVTHVDHCLIQIGAERKLHNNHRQVFCRGRRKRFQTRKARARGLKRPGHLLLDILRPCARVG